MSDSPVDPAPDSGTSRTPIPTWVKVFGAVIGALVLLLIVAMFAGGHGPGRHLPSGGASSPDISNATEGRTPPEGGHR